MSRQQTVSKRIQVDGINLYNGKQNSLTLHPAPENSGINFKYNGAVIPADLDNAHHSRKVPLHYNPLLSKINSIIPLFSAINLKNEEEEVAIVEHVLAAVLAAGIDNLLIELSDGVCPTPANGTKEYFHKIKNNLLKQKAEKTYWTLNPDISDITITPINPLYKGMPDFIRLSKSDNFSVKYIASNKSLKNKYSADHVIDMEGFENVVKDGRLPLFLPNALKHILLYTRNNLIHHGIDGKNYPIITGIRNGSYQSTSDLNGVHAGQLLPLHKTIDVLGEIALTRKNLKNIRLIVNETGHGTDIPMLKKIRKEYLVPTY